MTMPRKAKAAAGLIVASMLLVGGWLARGGHDGVQPTLPGRERSSASEPRPARQPAVDGAREAPFGSGGPGQGERAALGAGEPDPAGLESSEPGPTVDRGPRDLAVLLGQLELEGGTRSVMVDGHAFRSITRAGGTFRNATSRTLTGVAITLEQEGDRGEDPRAWRIDVGPAAHRPRPFPGGFVATAADLSVEPGGLLPFAVREIEPKGASELHFRLTPSYRIEVAGAAREANALPPFEPTTTSRSVHSDPLQLWHPTLIADVLHSEQASSITKLEGQLFLPEASAARLLAVHLQDARDGHRDVAGTARRIDGEHFELSDFPPLTDSGHYVLVLELSAALEGGALRSRLAATFDP